MALVSIDDRELKRLFDLIASYEALVEWLQHPSANQLCLFCHTNRRHGSKYCASCIPEVKKLRRREYEGRNPARRILSTKRRKMAKATTRPRRHEQTA